MVLAAIAARPARGDGGTVRLVRTVGPFVLTVFSLPEPLRVGPADVSVLVQDRAGGGPVLDARVTLAVLPPDGDAPPRLLEATHDDATNKLLYAARLVIDRAGTWTVRVAVRHGADTAEAQCPLPVAARASGLSPIWPYLALPPLVIALYALRSRLQRRRRSGASRPAQSERRSTSAASRRSAGANSTG